DLLDIVLGDVVPAALVVGDSEFLRHGRRAGKFRVLGEQIPRRGAEENKDVKKTALRHPVGARAYLGLDAQGLGVLGVLALGDVDPRLCGVQPENTDAGCLAVGLHEGNRAVERHRAVEDVLEDVGVVHAIRLLIVALTAASLLESHGASVGRDTKDMLVADEGNVEGNALRAAGLGVGVAAKRLLPPGRLVFLLWLLLFLRLLLLAFLIRGVVSVVLL